MKIKILFLFLLKTLCTVNSYRILIVFPVPAPSHYILGNALAKGLANAGHDVTMMSSFEEKNPPKNGKYRSVVLTGAQEMMINSNLSTWAEMGEMNVIHMELYLIQPANALTNFVLNHQKFQELIHSEEKFDVIILEQFLIDCLKILGCHFDAPVIMLSTLGPNFWVNSAAGNPSPSSYITDIFLTYTNEMSFWQRTVNSAVTLIKYIHRDLRYIPKQIEQLNEHFPHCPKIDNFFYNVSLTLLNYHESINYPVPLVPSMIPIGGFHINQPKKLPKDLQEYLDNAKDGVIYFSLGSNMLTWMMSSRVKEIIINTLGKRKEKVVWKWDEDAFPGKPDNIKIGKWFPQQDILAHPNVKLFISHGGLLGTTEAVYHGVPILALPVFGDQKLNGNAIENHGYGLNLWLNRVTEKELTEKLNKLVNDPKYLRNIKKRSALLHDRPVQPLNLAIYWVEFVARHKGAPHLRVGGLDLTWYQYFLLDVIAAAFIIILIVVIFVKYAIKKMWRNFICNEKIKTN